MANLMSITDYVNNPSTNITNVLFCHGTGYYLAHIPGVGLVGITSLNNACKFKRIISFNNIMSYKVQFNLNYINLTYFV